MTNYDIIDDVHGHADALQALLERMGYVHARGAFRHPSRTAIFVGDLIDRGPANIKTSLMVRRMVEEGAALIVMGNHEFNAVAYHTEDPEKPGEFLRPNDKKNTEQHGKTLAEFEARPNEARELLDWFATLPLYLDLPEIRVVHACWCRESIAALRPLLNPDGSMSKEVFAAACRKGSCERKARDILVSGPEIELPDGQSFKDKDGHPRTEMRLQWWLCGDGPLPLKQAGLGLNDEERNKLPDDFVSPEISARFAPDGKPTFFGHYWLTDMPPEPSSPTAVCVDYSMGDGGQPRRLPLGRRAGPQPAQVLLLHRGLSSWCAPKLVKHVRHVGRSIARCCYEGDPVTKSAAILRVLKIQEKLICLGQIHRTISQVTDHLPVASRRCLTRAITLKPSFSSSAILGVCTLRITVRRR